MQDVRISPASLSFLSDLTVHNDREWFQENRARYEAAHANMLDFAGALHAAMSEIDHIVDASPKRVLFRIYRDVRFSKNKSPYKDHWSGRFKRATAALRGGYYFHIMPGGSFVAGGFWGPNKEDLKRIRQEIALDADELREILDREQIRRYFGSLGGSTLKTAPKGFARDHPNVDLLRYKQFILRKNFDDETVLGPDFIPQMIETFVAMHPFFDYMSDVLTTDANGRSLLG